MASQPNIEYEAAKFLQKLIQDSKDEPDKLATKLYVILQHMKASRKENSLPYQVISRAMETVVNQHGFDMESFKPPLNAMDSGGQIGNSLNPDSAGCSQIPGAPQDSNSSMRENDLHPSGSSSVVPDTFPGSVPHRNAISIEHESPSSIDTKSANSASFERRDSSSWEQQATQKDNRSSVKRKRLDLSVSDAHMDNSQQQLDAHIGTADARKGTPLSRMDLSGSFPGTSSLEPSAGKGTVGSDYWKQGLPKDASISFPETSVQGHLSSTNQREMSMGGAVCNSSDMNMRSGNPRDTGKSPMLSTPAYAMPFKEHHLKQLRAQCLVFLAFRNGLLPKRPHLEIALGNSLSKEGSSAEGLQSEPVDNKAKEMALNEQRNNPDTASRQGNVATVKTERVPPSSFTAATSLNTDISKKEGENGTPSVEKAVPFADPAVNSEERKQLLATQKAIVNETRNHETARVPAFLPVQSNTDLSSMNSSSNHDNNADNRHLHAGALSHESPVMNKQLTPEMVRWAAVGGHNETSRVPFSASIARHELLNRKESSPSPSQGLGEIANQGHQYADGNMSNSWKQTIVPPRDATTMLLRHASNADTSHMIRSITPLSQIGKMHESGELDKLCGGAPPPKYTTSEKWIMIQQKRRIMNEENWKQKQQKVDQRIAVRFSELKETVNSSDDISAKTRSVIELKKLQLLGLQRRLRSNIVNDFFKPITMEIDRLKAIKKHRIGRRMKHVERYEQRMKEERQKRIRERQKEFFSELEVHRERLDDVFKFKRERCKGFNRYAKEFHKRKERVHREKIDRIQREKINLLKINDVEGYLRMVQDAKSDRVKQLLKETEKYLQKLSAKLHEAKSISKRFGTDTEENQSASVESYDMVTEAEDESDQAKHYKESNEKYYLMAHSIKETIPEQPAGLRGGKLREYQMNGLRWLVSLYNNHLNGILADEMGLGKTVQVISLICYLMETKNDRGPFLVVVPSSVLPGWESELNFWAPGVNKIIYSGPPEERRRLFKERIVQQKFNVLLTTYEYLMNKHDRPKLTKVQWRYIIIDEGHRIKNASCKLNADLKLYQSSHRLLLTGTPLQNNLEELWALLNFLLPNIFNSSEDFSQWFNKPFESNGDNSPDEALLSEEENLLIINRLHQVLRPFVLRRLKHKVENELPEKIERLVRCEASAYQNLLMKRVEDNLGALGNSKARAVHNSVMELRNICNHPYISQLHSDEVDTLIPKHFLPPIVRLCGKLEMLDRLLPKLKATNHRVLLFSTMTRLLDVLEEYLAWKKYRYLRLDGHTSGLDRGALIDQFNRPDSPYFIFLLSIRAGGVGVNLQAADTVIIFDTDWNPQVDLQAQARAHRIGQKKDVLVLRLETVNTVEEQVRASAEHKLGVANQSITAGFFDNNTSAEDRREYLEALLRESKKEEAAPVLEDDALNYLLARSELEIDVFESVDQKRCEEEMTTWKKLTMEQGTDDSHVIPPLPSRLVTEDDLKSFNEAMKIYEVSGAEASSDGGFKRKGGGFDTQHYGRGKRSREVRSYEEQWTEEEFEKLCQAESADALKLKDELAEPQQQLEASLVVSKTEPISQIQQTPPPLPVESSAPINTAPTPPVKRGRGRPRRIPLNTASVPSPSGPSKPISTLPTVSNLLPVVVDPSDDAFVTKDVNSANHETDATVTSKSHATTLPISPPISGVQSTPPGPSISAQTKVQNPKGPGVAEPARRRGRKPGRLSSSVSASVAAQDTLPSKQSVAQISVDGGSAPTGLPAPVEQSKPITELKEFVSQPSSALPIASGNLQDVAVDKSSQCITAPASSLANAHASENQKLRSGGDATAVVKPSPLSVANEVSCTPNVSAAAKPPAKRQRRKSQSGPESSASGPIACEIVRNPEIRTDPSSTVLLSANENPLSTPRGLDSLPGRRQTRRSMGRGKGQNLGPTSPVTLHEQPNPGPPSNTSFVPISLPQSVVSVPAVPGSGILGVVQQVVDVPVISLAPVLGYVQSSSVSQNTTVSLHNLSSVPSITTSSQFPSAVDPAPRRRGRKRGRSSISVDKGVCELKKTTVDDSILTQSHALVGRDIKPEDQHGLSSHVVKPSDAPSSFKKSDLEAKKIDSSLQVNNASLTSKSSTAFGDASSLTLPTTRFIVLALKTSGRTADLIPTKDGGSKREADVECVISQPEVNVAPNAGSIRHLDEDMIAPPGFNTPHAYSADTTLAGMSLPSEDNSTGKQDADAAGSDQKLMDPVQMVEEVSAPPGFNAVDASLLKARVVGSLDSEHRDSSDASTARARDFEPTPVLTAAPDENVEDSGDLAKMGSVPPGFGVSQSDLAEDESEKVALGEADVISSEVQTTAEVREHSACQEATEKPPLLQTEIISVDGCVKKCGNESFGDGAVNVQEEKDHVHQETAVSDVSTHKGVSDSSFVPNSAGIVVSSEENLDTIPRVDQHSEIQPDAITKINVDDGSEIVMCEQEIIHRPNTESLSRDGIQTQAIPQALLEPGENEQGSNKNEDLIAGVAELGQATAYTSTDEHNLVLARNVALHNGGKDEDDVSHLTDSGMNSDSAPEDKEEQHEGQNDNAHPKASCASSDTEPQNDKVDPPKYTELEEESNGPSIQETVELEEESKGPSIQETEEQDTVLCSPEEKMNAPQDTESQGETSVLTAQGIDQQDISLNTTATRLEHDASRVTDSGMNSILASQDKEEQHEGQDDCGVVNVKIDSLTNTELKEELKQPAIQEIEEQGTSPSPIPVAAQKDKTDSQILPDDLCGPKGMVEAPQNTESQEETIEPTAEDIDEQDICLNTVATELKEELKQPAIQEIEEQGTSPSPIPVAAQKDQTDSQILPDDLCGPKGMVEAPQNTESQEETIEPTAEDIDEQDICLNTVATRLEDDASHVTDSGINSILASEDKEEQHEGQDDSVRLKATCSSSDTEPQNDKMDPEIPSDADCEVFKLKLDSPENTELKEESKEEAEIEEQGTSLSLVTIQKDEADPEILPDADRCGPEEKVDAQNTELKEGCKGESEIEEQDSFVSSVASQKSEADPEMLPDADLCGPEEKADAQNTELQENTELKEEFKGESEEQDTSLSSVTTQKDEADPEMLPDADRCGPEEKTDAPQNTELQENTELKEESKGECEEQDTSLSSVATQKDEADPEILPDADRCGPEEKADAKNTELQENTELKEDFKGESEEQDTSLSSVATQNNEADPEILPNVDRCGPEAELKEESKGEVEIDEQDTSLSSIATQKDEVDPGILPDADHCGPEKKTDAPQNTESKEESKGQDEIEEQDTSLSSVATQKNEADPEILPDANRCGPAERTDVPQNTELKEETSGTSAQVDQQDTSLITIATRLEDDASHVTDSGFNSSFASEDMEEQHEGRGEILPDSDLRGPEETKGSTESQEEPKGSIAEEIDQKDISSTVATRLEDDASISDGGINSTLASENNQEQHEGLDDSAHPKATCASSDTEPQNEKMDPEIPSDAVFEVLTVKIDSPKNTELKEESKEEAEIEEQDTSLSPVATQKDEALEILPDSDLCGPKEMMDAPQNTESQDETNGPTAQKIDQEDISLKTVATRLEDDGPHVTDSGMNSILTSEDKEEQHEEQNDCRVVHAKIDSPKNTEIEEQSSSPVVTQMAEADPEILPDTDLCDPEETRDVQLLKEEQHEEQNDCRVVHANIDSPKNTEIEEQSSSPVVTQMAEADPEILPDTDLCDPEETWDVPQNTELQEETNVSKDICLNTVATRLEDTSNILDSEVQKEEVGPEQPPLAELCAPETKGPMTESEVSTVLEIEQQDVQIDDADVLLSDSCSAKETDDKETKIDDEMVDVKSSEKTPEELQFDIEAEIKANDTNLETEGRETPAEHTGCFSAETECKIETDSEIPSEASFLQDDSTLSAQAGADDSKRTTDDEMDDFKPCEDPDEIQELNVEPEMNATAKTQATDEEIDDFKPCEDPDEFQELDVEPEIEVAKND